LDIGEHWIEEYFHGYSVLVLSSEVAKGTAENRKVTSLYKKAYQKLFELTSRTENGK
jgi:hypothetical protein